MVQATSGNSWRRASSIIGAGTFCIAVPSSMISPASPARARSAMYRRCCWGRDGT
jgi:hypothetical protein